MLGFFYSRVLPVLLAILCMVLGKAAIDARAQAREVPELRARVEQMAQTITERGLQIQALQHGQLTAEQISQAAAQACASSVRLRQTHSVQAREILRAPDPNTAVTVYRSLLCLRPEATGHPACGSAPTG